MRPAGRAITTGACFVIVAFGVCACSRRQLDVNELRITAPVGMLRVGETTQLTVTTPHPADGM